MSVAVGIVIAVSSVFAYVAIAGTMARYVEQRNWGEPECLLGPIFWPLIVPTWLVAQFFIQAATLGPNCARFVAWVRERRRAARFPRAVAREKAS